ncbi:sialidase family protein [Terracoccus sp. 273MFTsu3.1]|uniref:sialidase family protein n=1 Tax=Terracoccus sp. 273MFTsu3.1 TaxID=1172188 RepID=UPI000366B151|nr:sialidase family protein [Terracoccus sp. 273MFTsu3.1]
MGNTRRRRVAVLASLGLVSFAFTAVPAIGPASAAPPGHAHASPHLKHAQPLRVNELLDGRDEDNGAPEPTISALCQSFLGAPNPYANPAPNVDAIVGDSIVQVGSQAGCAAAQNETTVAVDPANPRHLVAGANDYRLFNSREARNDSYGFAYTSLDGGATWTNVALPHLTFQTGATGALSDMDAAGDPAIAFGRNNTVYYANIAFSRLNDGSAITVNVSHDGGFTWSEPTILALDGADANGNPVPTDFFNDKEWVGVDQNSGAAYVSWTRFGPSGSPIVVTKSIDGGTTWSAPTSVTPAFTPGGVTPFDQGSFPLVGSDGAVYIAYEGAVCQTLACDQATDHDAVIVAKSTNGGASFASREVSADFDFPFNADVGSPTLTGENFRINSYPSMAIDRTNNRLYVTWADDRNGSYDSSGQSTKTNGDVFVATSGNGVQWQAPVRLGSSADEVFPAVAAYNGRVAVSTYTRSFDTGGIGLDVVMNGATGIGNIKKSPTVRVTTQTSNPQVQFVTVGAVSGQVLQGAFIGDYTSIAMGSDLVAHPVWTDFRGNPTLTGSTPNQEVYSASMPVR